MFYAEDLDSSNIFKLKIERRCTKGLASYNRENTNPWIFSPTFEQPGPGKNPYVPSTLDKTIQDRVTCT